MIQHLVYLRRAREGQQYLISDVRKREPYRGFNLQFALLMKTLSCLSAPSTLCNTASSVSRLTCSRKQTQMAGDTYCIFHLVLEKCSPARLSRFRRMYPLGSAAPLIILIPVWALKFPSCLREYFWEQPKPFSLLMSTAHLLFFYRTFTASVAKYAPFFRSWYVL